MANQLVLPIGVDEASPGLENYISGPNDLLFAWLKGRIDDYLCAQEKTFSAVYLWGTPGCGKTHLLCALSEWAASEGGEVVHLHPEQASRYLKGGSSRVYFLDDLESFAENAASEQALLTLFEQIRQQNGLLFLAARGPVTALGIGLPDLSSRLHSLDSFEVKALPEAGRRAVVCERAQQRGIELGDEVLNWLFTHASRDLAELLGLLDQIDALSLAQKRRVTIPLIRSIIES